MKRKDCVTKYVSNISLKKRINLDPNKSHLLPKAFRREA